MVTVIVRDCSSSHSPHHAMVGGQVVWARPVDPRAVEPGPARAFGRRGDCAKYGGPGFRGSIRRLARIRCQVSGLRHRVGRSSRDPAEMSTLVASVPGSVGGSDGGFKGCRSGTPVGLRLDGPRPPVETGPVSIGTGGSQIGTGCQMRCLGMIQVVAGGPLSSGIVELWPSCDKAAASNSFSARMTVLRPAPDSAMSVRIDG